MNRSVPISFIRITALFMIILCHIFQGENMLLAWWFNVGVQIFLFLSGFLYGGKQISQPGIWLKKQFQKILAPYYVLIVFILVFYLIAARNLLSVNAVFTNLFVLQGVGTGLPGIEHLWFITYILICYLFTPVLQIINFSKTTSEGKQNHPFIKLLLILFGLQLFNFTGTLNLTVSNIAAYIIGYYFSRQHFINGLPNRKLLIKSSVWIISLCAVTTPFILYMEYFGGADTLTLIAPYEYVLFNWHHVLLGITIFLLLYCLFERVLRSDNKLVKKICKFGDTFSYPIYLTHQIFILGNFSLLNVTGIKAVNIVAIFLLSVISGILLQTLSKPILKKFSTSQTPMYQK